MKKIIALSLLTMGMLIFSGCSLYNSAPNNVYNTTINPQAEETPAIESPNTVDTPDATTTTVKPEQDETPAVESGSVSIENFSFTPATLTVKKGATVTWTNNDTALHTVKSEIFNSGTLGREKSFSFTFNDAGTFDYVCSLHFSMKGKIIVE